MDVATGDEVPVYTAELVRRFPSTVSAKTILAKSYPISQMGLAYRIIDHPARVRRLRRESAILHIDSQLLSYLIAFRAKHWSVITCHDLVPFLPEFDDPSYVSRDQLLDKVYYRFLARGLRRAERIIAVSNFVKDELLRIGISPARIDVVPQGLDLGDFHPRNVREFAGAVERYGIPSNRPVVLFVGSEHPRKNLPALLRAFARAAHGTDAILVKVGAPRQPQRDQLVDLVQSLGLNDRVLFIDRVAGRDLPLLFSAAQILVLPSLHEGFGLPPLEAMASGSAVIASNTTSLPELVADAGMLVDPTSDDAIANGLARLLGDASLREELRARGLARARLFSWERTVAGVLEVYGKVVETA